MWEGLGMSWATQVAASVREELATASVREELATASVAKTKTNSSWKTEVNYN